MQNLWYKIAQLMYGRYGMDKLNGTLGTIWFIVSIINALFLRSLIVRLLTAALFVWIIFRCFSHNMEKRYRENQIFLRFCQKAEPLTRKFRPLFQKIAQWFKLQYRKLKDIRTHRYIKCRYCKAVIRVPYRKGRHTVRCPKCREELKTNIRF